MRVVWLTNLPREIERECFAGAWHGSQHESSWIVGHLPPPPGVELHLVSFWPGGAHAENVNYKDAGVHIVPCPPRGRALTLFAFDHLYMRGRVAELDPDIVHGWGTEDSYATVAMRLGRRRAVVSVQGVVNEILRRAPGSTRVRLAALMERRAVRRAPCLVAESDFSAGVLRRLSGGRIVHVVEQPVRAGFRSAEPSPMTEKHALLVAHIKPEKGVFDAVEAFEKAAAPGWTLRIVGQGGPGRVAELRRRIAASPCAARLSYVAHMDAPALVREFRNTSLLLLPTYVDSGPTVLKEAMCMGVWPVCYDNSGPAYYIRRLGLGSTAGDRDVEDLSRQLAAAMADIPGLKKKRDGELRNVRDWFSASRAWDGLLDLYRGVG